MYHPQIISRRLDKIQLSQGWRPTPSPIEDVEKALTHFDQLLGADGTLTRQLTESEVNFIRNERLMCAADFRYYCTRYVWIRDWQLPRLVRLVFNVAQEYMLEVWADLELQGRSVSVQILKARQLGMSTLCESAMAHRLQFSQHFTGVVGSSDPEKSTKMSAMIENIWWGVGGRGPDTPNMPWWLMPQRTRYNVGELIEFGQINTKLSIQHGTQRSGIARGDTVNGFHLSEVSGFANPEEIVDASLEKATHGAPGALRLQESTAKGRGRNNYWHGKWQFNKKNYWAGKANYCPVFLPWYVGTDIWPDQTWMRDHPIPKDWTPATITLDHAEKAQEYVKNDPILQRLLGPDWVMPRRQQWFWEVERGVAEASNALAKWYEEMPADDHEAFQSSGHSVFSVDLIAELRGKARPPLGIYGIVGDPAEIPLKMQPDRRDIDFSLPPINITANWDRSTSKPHEYQLLPLKMANYPNIDPENKLFIWEMPRAGQDYWLSLDTSYGIGQDQTALQVGRKGTLYHNDFQAAEFTSQWLGAMDIWPHALALLTLFSVPKMEGERPRQIKAVIEVAANGEVTQLELRKRGWNNFHQWMRYDKKKLDQSKTTRVGWFTTNWSRHMALDTFIKAVRDGWLDINSPFLLDEMSTFEAEGPRGKMEAASGEDDDRVMAYAFGHFAAWALESIGARQDMSERRLRARQEARQAPQWSSGLQGRDARPFGEVEPQRTPWEGEENEWRELHETRSGVMRPPNVTINWG